VWDFSSHPALTILSLIFPSRRSPLPSLHICSWISAAGILTIVILSVLLLPYLSRSARRLWIFLAAQLAPARCQAAGKIMPPRRRSVVFIPLPVAFFAVPMPRFHRGAAPAEHPLFSARLLISLLCRAGCSLPGAAPVQQAPAMSRPIHGVQFSPKRLLPGASSPRAQPRPCFPSLSAPCIHGTRQLWLGCRDGPVKLEALY
jgi:hypothetical protein